MRDNKHDGKAILFNNNEERNKAIELAKKLGYKEYEEFNIYPEDNCIYLNTDGDCFYLKHESEKVIPLDYLDEPKEKSPKETVTAKECYLELLHGASSYPSAGLDYKKMVKEAHEAAKAFNERKED